MAILQAGSAVLVSKSFELYCKSTKDDGITSFGHLPSTAVEDPVTNSVNSLNSIMKSPIVSPLFFTLLAALAIAISYADRSNLSTAIIPMASQLKWGSSFSGIVLSLFWLGYALTQVIGGNLADRIGGERLLPIALVLWSFCTGVTPLVAHTAVNGEGLKTLPLLLTRVALGAGEGIALPSVHSMIKNYVSPQWRSLCVSIITAACYLGSVVSNAASPRLIANYGWESVFTSFALIPTLLWLPTWYFSIVKPTEDRVKSITSSSVAKEARINQAGSTGVRDETGTKEGQQEQKFVPLVQACLKQKSVWAIIIAQYTQSWGLLGLLSWLPSYFSDRFQVPLSELAVYTTTPYLLQLFGAIAAGYLADTMINRWDIRTLRVRQIMQTVGMIAPAVCLSACVWFSKGLDLSLASILVSVGLALSALTVAGVSCNHMELSNKYAGTIFALGNTASSIGGLLAAPVAGWIFQTTGSWDNVFLLFAAHYVVGSLAYLYLASDQSIESDISVA